MSDARWDITAMRAGAGVCVNIAGSVITIAPAHNNSYGAGYGYSTADKFMWLKLLDERDEWLRGIADDARELERMLKVLRAAEAWFDAQTQETERMLMDAVDAYR